MQLDKWKIKRYFLLAGLLRNFRGLEIWDDVTYYILIVKHPGMTGKNKERDRESP